MIPTMIPGAASGITGFNPNAGSNNLVEDTLKAVEENATPSYNPLVQAGNESSGRIDDAMQSFHDLAMHNPDYMESYLKAEIERENTKQAQDWYQKMSDTSYSRAMEDIKKAGYNPYLVLNGLNGAGSGSVSPAGSGSVSGSQVSAMRENNMRDSATNIFRGLASVVGIALVALASL